MHLFKTSGLLNMANVLLVFQKEILIDTYK